MKDVDLFARVQYWRIFSNLLFPCLLAALIGLPFIGWKSLPIFLLVNILLPFPLILLTDLFANFCVVLYGGFYKARPLKDELACSELTKSKYCKTRQNFSKALHHVNKSLTWKPDVPEALLLKAQILSEGFANDGGAKACLEKILHMENPIDESIRQRAITQLDAIQERDTTGKI